MPYLLAAIAAISFAAGFGTAYKVYSGEAEILQAAINHSNGVSAQELKLATAKLRLAEVQADKLNTELESAHESDIKTINHYADKLAAVRVPKPTRSQSCTDPVPATKHTPGDTKVESSRADISEESLGFLKGESYRADQLATDRNMLLTFVQSNCGIQK